MITTLTPNPSIDRTVSVEKFDLYKPNRVQVLRSDFGGKGLNVATAVVGLGGDSCALGLTFSEDETAMRTSLQARGVVCEFVSVPGKTRTCYKMFDQSLQHTIEITESGCEVPAEAAEKLKESLLKRAEKSGFVVLAGSLPKGFPVSFYADCVRSLKQNVPSCRILVDAEKNQLLKALAEGVSILKPNIHEFQEAFQCQIRNLEQLDREARKVVRQYGVEILCVSLGGEGAYITNGIEAYRCHALTVPVRSIQGAGDSVVAGMCLAMEQKKPLPEILHYGVAAAADTISREGTQFCTKEGVEHLLKQDIGLVSI